MFFMWVQKLNADRLTPHTCLVPHTFCGLLKVACEEATAKTSVLSLLLLFRSLRQNLHLIVPSGLARMTQVLSRIFFPAASAEGLGSYVSYLSILASSARFPAMTSGIMNDPSGAGGR